MMVNKCEAVKTFINMQLWHRRGSKWNKSERQLAMSLFYKSPGTYAFMINKLKFVLPAIRTIQNWLKVLNLRTGMKTTLTKKLTAKARTMSENERMCVVLFDEISLKKQLEYNKYQDAIEGFQDLANYGKEPVLANTALVFYIRGLLYNWKIPLGYYTSAGPVKSEVLHLIVKDVIRALKKMTFNPLMLVCDQGSNNRRALEILGASAEHPEIIIDSHKIFTCFDSPHLVKSLRNNFMNKKLNFFVNGKSISWSDIVQTYDIDQKSTTTRAMLKIRNTHINPTNFQKMKVKYATQIFSHTVAAAVKTAKATSQLKSNTALDTAEFIDSINNIFDALNSRVLYESNPHKRPLSIYYDKPENVLLQGLTLIKSIDVYETTNNVKKKRNNIYCLEGFQWTIRSILLLWSHLKTVGIKYLLTNFLNQDPIENFFSVVRSRGGYNPTPTVRQFRIAMQHNSNIRLQMEGDGGNCVADDAMVLELSGLENDQVTDDEKENQQPEEDTTINLTTKENDDVDYVHEMPGSSRVPHVTLETCTTAYVAGYLVHKQLNKLNCEHCLKNLLKTSDELLEKSEAFILNKDYGCSDNIDFLKRPSEQFLNITTWMLNRFNTLYEKYKLCDNILKVIETDIVNELSWLHEEPTCSDHRKNMVKLLCKMKIFRNLKWQSDSATSKTVSGGKSLKPHRKVRILT